MRLTTRDHTGHREHYTARTSEQLVGMLWKAAFLTESSPGKYMQRVSARVALRETDQQIEPVRSDSARHFLEDLVSRELISIDWEEHDR